MLRAREANVRGIVVGRAGAGEGSVRLLLYSDLYGLVTVLAKSAREERSQLRAHVQGGTFGIFSLVGGRTHARVVGAFETKNPYFFLRGRPQHQAAAGRVLHTIRELVHGAERNQELFEAVWRFLNALPTITDAHLPAAEEFVTVAILTSLGYSALAPIPAAHTFSYSSSACSDLTQMRGAFGRAIQEGFAASGLLHA